MKKGWIFATIFVSCALLVYIFFQINRGKSYNNDFSLAALPSSASVIVKAANLQYLQTALFQTIDFTDELNNAEAFVTLSSGIQALDSLQTQDGIRIIEYLNDLPFYCSLHSQGKESVSPLFMFEIPNRKEEVKILRFVDELPSLGYGLKDRKYNSKTIFEISNNKQTFYAHIDNGLLLLSTSNLLIESSIRQQQRDEMWMDDDAFKQIYKTIGAGSKLNVFVNFQNLPEVIKPLVAKAQKKGVNWLQNQSYWAELDVEVEDENILFNGFMSGNNKGILSQLLANSQPQRSKMHDVLPRNTRAYIAIGLESGNQLKQRILKYHELNDDNDEFERKIEQIQKQYDFNVKNELFAQLTGSMALAYGDYNHLQPKANGTLILKLKSQSAGKELIIEMLRKLQKQSSLPKIAKLYKPDNDVSYTIYHGFPNGLMSHFFGALLPKVPQAYVGFYDDNVIFADAPVLIEQFIYSNMLNKTLSKSRTHQAFLSNFASRENAFVFCETAHLSPIVGQFFDKILGNINASQKEALSNFYGVGLQLSGTGKMIYTTAFLQYLPARESEPRTIWQSLLDSTTCIKPTLVKNHYTNEREVLVQDEANNLYLLSNSGRVLWKKPLDSRVMSEIVQVDYYRNNKLQYLFNTQKSIFLLDRNGNNVDKFPVRLPSEASNGIAVFDYDKNRKYRMFVACKNRRVYLYDGTGNIVSGWKFNTSDGEVSLPVQHFRSNGKDYIAFADDKRNYICDRKGNIRVKLDDQFVRSAYSPYFIENENKANDCLVTTSKNGILKKINLTNGTVTDSQPFEIEGQHALKLLVMDDKLHYLLSENKRVACYTINGKKVFEKEFESEINLHIDVYQFSAQNIKFGVSEKDNGNIYLLNRDGKLYKGFPLKGNSRFSIGFLKSSASRFNLIVGGSENYLYNYQVD